MKITPTILSIPPHISTTWDNVASLRSDGSTLIVTLQDQTQVAIPNLDTATLEEIFDMHAKMAAPLLPIVPGELVEKLAKMFTLETAPQEPEEVLPEDLKFKDWEIVQKGDQIYEVISPLDKNEHYQVFLGTPLGCTCGAKNCEHIRAVLNS
jgi:hypothetical protein